MKSYNNKIWMNNKKTKRKLMNNKINMKIYEKNKINCNTTISIWKNILI
jgi:hypothetical protein